MADLQFPISTVPRPLSVWKTLGGVRVLLDLEDLPKLAVSKWYLSGSYITGYLRGSGRKKPKKVFLHRHLSNCPAGLLVDHINGNTLDNRKANLRNCTQVENQGNRHKRRSDSKNPVQGAYWHAGAKKWRSFFMYRGCYVNLGYFQSPEEAGEAYLTAKRQLLGGNVKRL